MSNIVLSLVQAGIEDVDESLRILVAQQAHVWDLPQAKLQLWGRVSTDAFRDHLKTSCGRIWRHLAQMSAEAGVIKWFMWPCFGRLWNLTGLHLSSSLVTRLLAVFSKCFLVNEGSSFMASCTSTAVLNFFLFTSISACRSFSPIFVMMIGSWDVRIWLFTRCDHFSLVSKAN